ncbi:hypothetical protein IJ707_03335, partial [bacterium]|nr:hypothetical protein [bacterium]
VLTNSIVNINVDDTISASITGTKWSDSITATGDIAYTVVGNGGNDTINIENDQNNRITTKDGNDSIITGNGDNYIECGRGNDTIITGDGNDYINAGPTSGSGSGIKYIDSGDGNDTIVLNTTYISTIKSGVGDDSITVSNSSSDGGHLIEAGTGNDIINDYSAKNNIYVFNDGDGNDTITFQRAQTGTLQFKDTEFENMTWTLSGDSREDLIIGYGSGDTLTIHNVNMSTNTYQFTDASGSTKGLSDIVTKLVIYGNETEDDIINGYAWNDYIIAGSGDDSINGNGGNDTIIGGKGSDTIYGGDGNDVIYSGEKDAASDNGVVDNTEDTIDYLYGGAGNDTIYCYSDKNYAYGGADNDTYIAYLSQYTEIFDESGNDNLIIQDTPDNTVVYVNFKWSENVITDDYTHNIVDDTNLYIKHDTSSENGITIKGYFNDENDNKIENITTNDNKTMSNIDMNTLGANIQTWLNDYHGDATCVEEVLSGSDSQEIKNALIATFAGTITWT